MSQEQPPLRSRRELRQARNEAAPESGLAPTQHQAAPPARTDRVRRASSGPMDSVPERARERSSQVRARDRAALRALKEQGDKEQTDFTSGPPTRRQMRLRQLQEQGLTASIPVVPAPAGTPSQDTPGMTVEQALAARSDIAEQAKSHLARLEQVANQGPDVVDPRILQEQLALAERAAAINRKGSAPQRPANAATGTPHRTDPAAASNLGMVTPLEFMQVPGVDRPVLKPPATTYVPVVTQSTPKVAPSGSSRTNNANGRSWVIARAEAAARAAAGPAVVTPAVAEPEPAPAAQSFFEEQSPVAASAAYGLEPLDAATAGLARAQRSKYIQYGVLLLGVLALVTGLILIISGMTR